MFELEKSLDALRLVAEQGEKISKANIEKAGSGSSNLVKKKVLVQRGGKSFYQTFFVSAGSMADKEDRVTNERVEISTKQHHDNFDALQSHLKELSTMDVSKVTPEHLDKLRQLTKKVRDSHDDMRFHGADPAHVEEDDSNLSESDKQQRADDKQFYKKKVFDSDAVLSDWSVSELSDAIGYLNGLPKMSGSQINFKTNLVNERQLKRKKEDAGFFEYDSAPPKSGAWFDFDNAPTVGKRENGKTVLEDGKGKAGSLEGNTNSKSSPRTTTSIAQAAYQKQNSTTSNADTDTSKKVVSHDSFKHPNGTNISKGDKVTFDHKGVQKTGTVITTNKYQRFPNPYVKMKGEDGKVYEIVISKVNAKKDNKEQEFNAKKYDKEQAFNDWKKQHNVQEQPPGKYM